MHIAAFIGQLQNFENLKLSYLSTCKWELSLILSDQVTNHFVFTEILCVYCLSGVVINKVRKYAKKGGRDNDHSYWAIKVAAKLEFAV